jgi:hypothetical protein
MTTNKIKPTPLTPQQFIEQVVKPGVDKYDRVIDAIKDGMYVKADGIVDEDCIFCTYSAEFDDECCLCLINSACGDYYYPLRDELLSETPNQQKALNYANQILTAIKRAGEVYGE